MDDFESFLPYYERELALLRKDMRPFENKFPKAAARLSLSGGQTDDPDIERVIQSAAWFNARISQRIDDHHAQFHEAQVETAFPAYLRSIPSCSVAQLDGSAASPGYTQTHTIPAGTLLEHRPSLCGFTTVYDVTLAPLEIAHARFRTPSAAAQLCIDRLPDDTAGLISIEFASPEGALTPESKLLPQRLRIYLHAAPLLAAALTDAILLHPQRAFVQADDRTHCVTVEKPPASAVGFHADEALLNRPGLKQEPALRLLLEYAAFPHKFGFFDLDFDALLKAAGPCSRFALHIPIAGRAADAAAIERLRQLNAEHFRLFCTPVVNWFRLQARPADVKDGVSCYPVELPEHEGSPPVVHSIESVRMMHGNEGGQPGVEIPAHRSFRHHESVGVFWLLERDAWVAEHMTGSSTAIKLFDRREQPIAPKATKLAIAITCTNGDLAGRLAIGAPSGDLFSETADLRGPVTMLVAPTALARPVRDGKALLQLTSFLAPNRALLSPSGLGTLRALLNQFCKATPQRDDDYVAGLIGLDCLPIRRMMNVESIPMPILVAGTQVTLTIDETAFAGRSLHTFAALMEAYFLRFADNGCIELIVKARRGSEVYRGQPRLKDAPSFL